MLARSVKRGVSGGNGQGLAPPDSSRGRGATNHRTGRPLTFPGFGVLAAAADRLAGLYPGGSSGERLDGGIPTAAATACWEWAGSNSGGEGLISSSAGWFRVGAELNGFPEAGIGCSLDKLWYLGWDPTTPPFPDLAGYLAVRCCWQRRTPPLEGLRRGLDRPGVSGQPAP